jgi:cyclopropane-fatty-acyl-phospholipid synthase
MIQFFLGSNFLPDFLIRFGIRRLLRQRLQDECETNTELQQQRLMNFIAEMNRGPIAMNTLEANAQHYEVPTKFFQLVLGRHLKYSSGYWRNGVNNLDRAEHDMLELTCERAELRNGQRILELGCGWGSLSLFMAQRFPKSNITAVSNSRTQKQYIDSEAEKRGITNLAVLTADMNSFTTAKKFDRIVSVEMFEHMRNYKRLLAKISSFLSDNGKLFIHIFTHREYAYLFEVKDETDWMSKYFFTGGMMPSDRLLFYFNENVTISNHWHVSGIHYQKTAEAWLQNMDRHKEKILPLFEQTYGNDEAEKWWLYWRVFFMACAELWGYKNGDEWIVSHCLFEKTKSLTQRRKAR